MNGSSLADDLFNSSYRNPSVLLPAPNLVQTVISAIQALTIFLGSSILLIAFARNKALRTSFNYYLINVCLGLLILSIYQTFVAIQHYYGYWIYSKHLCTTVIFSFFFSEGVAGNSHFLISANRTWALYFPHHYRTHNSKRSSLTFCVFYWVATLVLVLPWVILNEPFLGVNGPLYMCRIRMAKQHPYSVIIMLLFLNPTAFIILSYPLLRRKKAAQKRKRMAESDHSRNFSVREVSSHPQHHIHHNTGKPTSPAPDELSSRKKKHSYAFLILTAVVITVLLFWTPIVLFGLGEVMFPSRQIFTDQIYFILLSWLCCATCTDPIIFVASVPLLRKEVADMFRSLAMCLTKPCWWLSKERE